MNSPQHCLLFRLVHASASYTFVQQFFRVGLAFLSRLQGHIFQNDIDAGHCGNVGNTLTHHPRAEYAQLIDQLLVYAFWPAGATVNFVKLEEERRNHILGDRRANEVGECA